MCIKPKEKHGKLVDLWQDRIKYTVTKWNAITLTPQQEWHANKSRSESLRKCVQHIIFPEWLLLRVYVCVYASVCVRIYVCACTCPPTSGSLLTVSSWSERDRVTFIFHLFISELSLKLDCLISSRAGNQGGVRDLRSQRHESMVLREPSGLWTQP